MSPCQAGSDFIPQFISASLRVLDPGSDAWTKDFLWGVEANIGAMTKPLLNTKYMTAHVHYKRRCPPSVLGELHRWSLPSPQYKNKDGSAVMKVREMLLTIVKSWQCYIFVHNMLCWIAYRLNSPLRNQAPKIRDENRWYTLFRDDELPRTFT